ncbi:SpoIIAA-like protein [Anaerobacterium chartisolvens]|uniref:SpoIIAA-like protein n=1 Tax=Anaerobacterium chartisolvens TaxID=1297424 RepID=A0A369AQ63_9FIRM|nr:STAS/SEC14 domain-containing protein [Anaerobacterium chartisolvens]RCX11255.1 SpoIIAA-like protein [Anaerobacterium chartisolvens]
MTINDPKGLYSIKLESGKNVVYETPTGLWTKDDYKQYHSHYVEKIGPALKGKKWGMVAVMKDYKTSSLSDELNTHAAWLENNGCEKVAIVVDSSIVKMQMNRAGNNKKFEQQVFTDINEAESWLSSKGFSL